VPPLRVSAESAKVIEEEWGSTGALVVGRHLYDTPTPGEAGTRWT
jgi:hypothetical protein